MSKVMFIMPDLPGGGAEKVLIDILRHWDYERCAVTLLLEFANGVYVKDVPAQVAMKVLPARIRVFRKASKLLKSGAASRLCQKIFISGLRRFAGDGYDAIVSFMEGPAVKLHSFLTGKARRNVSWVHIDMGRKHWSEAYFDGIDDEWTAYAQMDEVEFVSKQAKHGFENVFGGSGRAHSVVYNLIDAREIRRQAEMVPEPDVTDKPFIICMAGRLNRQKRYDRALEAAAILQSRRCDFELRIAGDGELLPEMKEMAAHLGIDDKIKFLGFRKPAYADMAAADVSGAREILGADEYGIVVPQDVDAVADALMALYNSPAERERLGAQALLRSEFFDVAGTMNKIYSILNV